MSSNRMTLFELKENAKWASDPEEKKTAIKELSNHGEDAISELQEIMSITAYEDIKNACAEAIISIQARSKVQITEEISPENDSNSSIDVDITKTKDQKKEEIADKEEATRETGLRLADLPP